MSKQQKEAGLLDRAIGIRGDLVALPVGAAVLAASAVRLLETRR